MLRMIRIWREYELDPKWSASAGWTSLQMDLPIGHMYYTIVYRLGDRSFIQEVQALKTNYKLESRLYANSIEIDIFAYEDDEHIFIGRISYP